MAPVMALQHGSAEQINPQWLAFRVALLTSGVRTLDRLSTLTGIERSRLSRISTGIIRPSSAEAQTIAGALHTSAADLFREVRQ